MQDNFKCCWRHCDCLRALLFSWQLCWRVGVGSSGVSSLFLDRILVLLMRNSGRSQLESYYLVWRHSSFLSVGGILMGCGSMFFNGGDGVSSCPWWYLRIGPSLTGFCRGPFLLGVGYYHRILPFWGSLGSPLPSCTFRWGEQFLVAGLILIF